MTKTMEFDFLFQYDKWIRFVHVAGAIIAVGAVTATDLLFGLVKFKPKLAPLMARIAPMLSLQVWLGFLLLSVSGLLLFLPMRGLENVSIFQLKMAMVAILFLNGIFLNVWVTPRFQKLAPEWHLKTEGVKKFTKIAGLAAAISFIGWWGVVILMMVFY